MANHTMEGTSTKNTCVDAFVFFLNENKKVRQKIANNLNSRLKKNRSLFIIKKTTII